MENVFNVGYCIVHNVSDLVKMLKPPKLKPGAILGIVCPSYHIDSDIYQKTSQYFIQNGFEIVEGETINLQQNLYAGTPEERAKDIMDMFQNTDIDAIICARGGYGANRVLPLLNYDIIKNNPKVFIGFSDITALLLSITQQTGLVTFHGPMFTSFQDGLIEYSYNQFITVLSGKSPIAIEIPQDHKVRVLKNGKAIGKLWGGNVCLIVNRIGTDGQLVTDDCILFLEDTEEQLYRLDRMFFQLKETGLLARIKGLIVGEITRLKDTDPPFGYSIDEIILDICSGLDIPIISNFPCGHGGYQATLPISISAELNTDSDDACLKLIESPVE